jgi:DNA-binding CsgD family transcriptional regulator
MGKPASRTRLRAVYRLVQEVCSLGHEAQTWPNRLMEGLSSLFHSRVVVLTYGSLPERPDDFYRVQLQLHHGFTPEQQRMWVDYFCTPEHAFQSEYLRRMMSIPARFVTVRRQDVLSDEEWYKLPEVEAVCRPCNVDPILNSYFVALSLRRLFGIGLARSWGEPQFTAQDRQDLRLLHLELARAWRQRISRPEEEDPAIRALTPRARQVLWLLCLGRSEKEVAIQLGLSPHTVHCHVRELHKTLSVHSRGELLSRALTQGGVDPVAVPSNEMNQFRMR